MNGLLATELKILAGNFCALCASGKPAYNSGRRGEWDHEVPEGSQRGNRCFAAPIHDRLRELDKGEVMPEWRRMIVHHSATKDTPALDAKAIKRFHMEERGWKDVGYAFLVELVGDKYIAVPGRSLTVAGAHCPGQNTIALGICLVGDFSEVEPPDAQLERTAELCAELCVRFGIDVEEIRPHREYRKTECPGLVPMEKLREMVGRRLFESGE
jgi:hypothetical protein